MSTAQATTPAAPAERKAARFCGITFNHGSNMIFLTQVALFCLYGGCTTFGWDYNVGSNSVSGGTSADFGKLTMHVFISLFVFLGFGFLFVQNTRYSWQSVGYSFAIGATTVEWAILLLGFWDMGKLTRNVDPSGWPPIPLDFNYLLNSLYIAATVLISYSAIAGRVSFAQAYAVAFFEVFFATANYIIAIETKVLDAGGSFFVHLFGATFGLFASWVICTKLNRDVSNQARSKEAGLFAFLGVIVLFALYPVFNIGNLEYLMSKANLTSAAFQPLAFRAYFNTIMAMASSVAAAFMVSKANSVDGSHFTIWQVQTPAIAGGAAIAATGLFLKNPWGALMLGAVVGAVATIAQTTVTPLLGKIGLHDTNGVFAGHFVPGVIGAFSSAIAAARVTEGEGFSLLERTALVMDGRDAKQQGGYQISFALISLVFALISGLMTGVVVNLFFFDSRKTANADDADHWEAIEGGAVHATTTANPVVVKAEEVAAPVPEIVKA